jgi:hypothetical protein
MGLRLPDDVKTSFSRLFNSLILKYLNVGASIAVGGMGEIEMSNSFMSPLPTFTLESLVTDGRWAAAQNDSRKKAGTKNLSNKKNPRTPLRSEKNMKSEL